MDESELSRKIITLDRELDATLRDLRVDLWTRAIDAMCGRGGPVYGMCQITVPALDRTP